MVSTRPIIAFACAAAALSIAFVAAGPNRADAATGALKPHHLKLLINGKRWPTTPLDGVDRYTDIPSGPQRVEARWVTDARGTGYHVVISTTEPTRVYRRCFLGTSCRVPKAPYLDPGAEVHWMVKVVKTRTLATASGFRVCATGA